ncbi:MAG: peptidylprolyl isomerase [Synechococcus sp.]
MSPTFNTIQVDNKKNKTVKIPKGYGHETTEGTVVELNINSPEADSSLFIELYDKAGASEKSTKKTAKNFLKYIKKGRYDNSFFHRSVNNFVIQAGGFSVPTKDYLDGGRPDSIKTFSTIKNEPGNPNVEGSLSMAKLAGDPDSATSQWFINLKDNDFLDTDNGGYTAFGSVLGNGMDLVNTMAASVVVPAADYYQNSALNELPLWEVNVGTQEGTEIANVRPQDFLTILNADKLGKKDALASYTVTSSDPSLVSATVKKNKKIALEASDSKQGTAEITITATSHLDGETTKDSFDVIVGNQQRQERRAGKRQKIDVYVDGGRLDAPYYNFFDAQGEQIDDLIINPKNRYTFRRLDEATSHPFYIAELDAAGATGTGIKQRGAGSAEAGIVGNERFKLRFSKAARQRLTTETGLRYFCTTHPSMSAEFSLDSGLTASDDPIIEPDPQLL